MTKRSIIASSVAAIAAISTAVAGDKTASGSGADKSPWDVKFDAGLDLSSGNTDSLYIHTGLNAERIREWDELYLSGSFNYGELEGENNTQDIYASAQYNKLLTERLYFGLRSDFLYDDIAELDYRVTVTPLLGYYIIKNERTRLSVEAGAGYLWEKQSDVTDSYAVATFGERFETQLTPGLKFWQTAQFTPRIDDFSDYTFIGRAGIETTLSERWSLLTYVEDRYDSRVADGIEKNDLGLYASLSYALTRANEVAPLSGSKNPGRGSSNSSPWDVSLSSGLGVTDGNTDTLLVTADLNARGDFGDREVLLGAGGAYGEVEDEVNAQRAYGFAQYNKTIAEPYYVGARVDYLYDEISLVDYRVTPAALLGVYLIKNETTTLAIEVGPGYTFEKLSGEAADSYFSVYFGERFNHKVSDRLSIYQSLTTNLDTTDTDNYVHDFRAGFDVALTERVSWRTGIQNIYDNQPADGAEENDFLLSTGFGINF